MKLRSALMGAALATASLTGAAFAGDSGTYIGLGVGWDSLNTLKFDYAADKTAKIATKDGALAVVSAGYRFADGLRLETEFNYTHHGLGSGYGGSASLKGGAFNALYDYALAPGWKLSAGGGLGYGHARVKADGAAFDYTVGGTSYSGRNQFSGGKSGFFWQLIAEASYAPSDRVELFADYRYRAFDVGGGKVDFAYSGAPSLPAYAGSAKIHDTADHAVMIGLRFFFNGGPAAAPPAEARVAPAAPPEPPPAPQPVVAPPVKTFIVFFDFDKTELSAHARDVIAAAVKTAKDNGFAKVKIVGHTDTAGSDAYNQALSVKRAETVKDEFVRLGIAAEGISTDGKSFHDLLVKTGAGVKEPQNRRAEIDLE